MKILIVTSYGFNDRMRNFIEFIIGRILAKEKWQVYAASKNDVLKTQSFVTDNIRVFSTANNISGFFCILKIMLFKKPDIIHIFNQRNNPLGIMTSAINKLLKIPLVFTEYGLLHDHYLIKDRNNPFPIDLKLNKDGGIFYFFGIFKNRHFKKNLKNYLFHFPLISADKILFISKHNLEVAKIIGLKNIYYLPHIFDNERWGDGKNLKTKRDFQKLELLKKYQNSNFILFIGQMKLRKGWDIILEAISCLNKNLNAKLLFITPLNEKIPELSKKIMELNIENDVIFLGKVEGKELEEIYKKSKVVVVPSRYEGFGLAVVEAWEMQKPVVASNVVAINEHVINGQNGLLVPQENPRALSEAIENVLKNNELKNKLIKGGNETLQKLKSEELKNNWLEFYESLRKN